MPACRIRFLNRARVKRVLGVIADPRDRAIFEETGVL